MYLSTIDFQDFLLKITWAQVNASNDCTCQSSELKYMYDERRSCVGPSHSCRIQISDVQFLCVTHYD